MGFVSIPTEEIEGVLEDLSGVKRPEIMTRGGQLRTGDPPCTPSFIQEVPNFDLSIDIEVAWPPVTPMRSIIVTLKRLGCWARVAAQD